MPVILGICIAVEAVLILKWKIATHAMVYYIEKKNYTQPNDKEMAECTEYVIKHMIKGSSKS